MQSADVSIIIRTYNEEKFIGEVLEKIFQQKTSCKYEVIIVDSESTDRTLEIVNAYSDVRIFSIKKEDFTFGYALNYGLAQSNAKFSIAISGHCIPSGDNWLESLVQPLENDHIGITYGKQTADHLVRISEKEVFRALYPEYEASKDEIFCNNANSAFRMSLWEKYRFDEMLPGLEDLDFAIKVTSEGFKTLYIPEACVTHVHDENNVQVFNRFYREEIAHKQIMQKKQFNFIHLTLLAFKEIVSDGYKSFREKKLHKSYKGIVGYRFAQYYALYLAHNIQKADSKFFQFIHQSLLYILTKGNLQIETLTKISNA